MNLRSSNWGVGLRLCRVSVEVEGRPFFKDLSWTVRVGERWAVVGPNASGKTLLARVLRGEVPVARGEVEYGFAAPRVRSGLDSLGPESQIGYVSFETQQSWLASAESYHQARWESGFEESSVRVDEWLSRASVLAVNPFEVLPQETHPGRYELERKKVVTLLNLRGLLGKRLRQLSNGEMRKVLLGRTLLQPHRLLILDDPLAGLDPATRRHLGQWFNRMMRAGLPTLYLTPRPEELPKGITHVLWLEAGRVLAQGRKTEVWRRVGGRAGEVAPLQVSRLPMNPTALVGCSASPPATRGERAGEREDACKGPKREISVRGTLFLSRAEQKVAPKPGSRPVPGRSPLKTVELTDVTVRYGEVVALDRFNWQIRRGEQWVVLGPNGSGKTTLLSLILGDHPQAYANDIRWFGQSLGAGLSVWQLREKIALVSPELQVHHPPSATALETVLSGLFGTLGLQQRPSARQRAQSSDWLRRFGLLTVADQPFGRLTVGQQRLVLLARALIRRPQLLVLDEPCQGLDARNRRRVLRAVENFGAEGRTQFIFVTHHPVEVPQCATHLLRLRCGRVMEAREIGALS